MDKKQFRQIQERVNILINHTKKEDLDRGIDITSDEYKNALVLLRSKLLEDFGLSVEEYEELRKQFYPKKITSYKEIVDTPKIPTDAEIQVAIDNTLSEYKPDIPAPQIINNTKVVKEIVKETPIIQQTERIIERVDEDLTEQLRLNLAELQLSNSDLWSKYMELQKSLPDIEKWNVLVGGKIADGLHQHDFRQRRGYGGVDKDTVLKLISENTVTPITTDEKVKYDASDPTAGYLGAKIVAGTGIILSEGAGGDENKLVITATGTADITAVGDVSTGAAFNGTQGRTLTFYNAAGNGELDYDGIFNFDKSVHIDKTLTANDLVTYGLKSEVTTSGKATTGNYVQNTAGILNLISNITQDEAGYVYNFGAGGSVQDNSVYNHAGAVATSIGVSYGVDFAGTLTSIASYSQYGMSVGATGNLGAVGTKYGSYIYTTGTAGTAYGVYVDVSGATNNYAIYTVGGKIQFGDLATAGFVKSSATGLLSVDTATYLTTETDPVYTAWYNSGSPTLNDISFAEITTPSTPADTYAKLYFKDDATAYSRLYRLDSNADEKAYLTEEEVQGLLGAGVASDYYLSDTASSIAGYYTAYTTETGGIEATFTKAAIIAGAQAVEEWATEANIPTYTTIGSGAIILRIAAKRTAGTRACTLKAQFYERLADNSEILIGTTGNSASLTATKTTYTLTFNLTTAYNLAASSRLVCKLLVTGASTGTNATIEAYVEGLTDSFFSARVAATTNDARYLRKDQDDTTVNDLTALTFNATGETTAYRIDGLANLWRTGTNLIVGQSSGSLIGAGNNYNIVVGDVSGTGLSTGDNNVFLGYSSGNSIETGNYNVLLGANTSTFGDMSSVIAIGTGATPQATNQMVLGSDLTKINDVYIGNGVTNSTAATDVAINASGGNGTNKVGGKLTLAGGKGTGNAVSSQILFQLPTVGTTGTTLQTLSTRMTLDYASLTLPDAFNLIVNATTGTKIGTATTQKLGFYNATPVVQQLATADLGTALSNLGLRASGTAYPITTTGLVVLANTTTALQIGNSAAGVDYRILFDGESSNGSIKYMEDESRFDFDQAVQVIPAVTSSLGLSIIPAGNITNTLSYANLNSIFTMGGSAQLNGYTAKGGYLEVTATRGVSSGTENTQIYGLEMAVLDSHTISGTADLQAAASIALKGSVISTNSVTATPSVDTYMEANGLQFNATSSKTFNYSGATAIEELIGGIVAYAINTDTMTDGNVSAYSIGIQTGGSSNVTGTFDWVENDGIYIGAVSASGGQCDLNVGLYIQGPFTGATNSYAIYDASGVNWALASDNQKILFGAGLDASLYYDGTDLVIDTAEVGSGVLKFADSGSFSTGAGTALLGTNSPATTNTAPYTWLKVKTSDGSTGYIPVWK